MSANENTNLALDDVLYSFSMEERPVSADLLDEYAKEYPQHVEALTDFAIELVLEDSLRAKDASVPPVEFSDPMKIPAVARAMSKFLYQFDTVRLKASLPKEQTNQPRVMENPFSTLDRDRIKSIAAELNVSMPFIIKLRDRAILAESIPAGFVARVAATLKTEGDKIREHFRAAPSFALGQAYKAVGKPSTAPQQSFKEAVMSSGLTDLQQRDLLALLP